MWMYREFSRDYCQCLKWGILLVIFFTMASTLTLYKGVVWGILSPLAGLLAVAPVNITKLQASSYTSLYKSALRLLLLVVLNWLLLSSTLKQDFNNNNVLQTSETKPVTQTTKMTMDETKIEDVSVKSFVTSNECVTRTQDMKTENTDDDLITSKESYINKLKNFALFSEGAWFLEYPESGHVASLYFLNIKLPWFLVDLKSDPSGLLQHDNLFQFSFLGSNGLFVIGLSEETQVKALSFSHMDSEHLSKPKDFSIYVSDNLQSWDYIGTHTYALTSEHTQYFHLQVFQLFNELNN